MKDLKLIITKAHRSWTLFTNWAVILIGVLASAAAQYFPLLKGEIKTEWFVVGMIVVSSANILLRAKTSKALEER